MTRNEYLEIAYNSSGCRDQTAYEVFKKMRKEEKAMKQFYAGDIWTMQTTTGPHEVLVLSVFENYSTILMLSTRKPEENSTEIVSKTIMYTDAGKISYGFHSRMLDFQNALPEPEFKKVLRKVGGILGMDVIYSEKTAGMARAGDMIGAECSYAEEKETLHEAANGQNGGVIPQGTVSQALYQRLLRKCVQMEAERDIYKNLFYKSCPQFHDEAAI